MVRRRKLFDRAERQSFATILPIEFDQGAGQRRPAKSLRQLHDFFIAMMDRIRERFLDGGFQQHHCLMLVEQNELRIDVRFHRKLMQQPRTEPVDRGDHSPFQRALMSQPALTLVAFSYAEQVVNRCAHALAHLVRGTIRERDGDDVIDGDFLGAENLEIAFDQHERFTRARPGGDREVAVERARGGLLFRFQLARFWMGRLKRHRMECAGRTKCRRRFGSVNRIIQSGVALRLPPHSKNYFSPGVFCACSAGAFGSYGVPMNFFATVCALS